MERPDWSGPKGASSRPLLTVIPNLTFGLGTSRAVTALEIEWPSGTKQRLTNVAANQGITVEEGKGIVAQWKPAAPR